MCAEYVEQYNFDVLEGMELMVFKRLKGPDDSGKDRGAKIQ